MNIALRTKQTGLLLAALLQTCLVIAPAHADVYDDLRTKWLKRTSSAPPLPADDPDVASGVDAAGDEVEEYWTTMDLTAGRTALWSDLPFGAKSANVTSSVSRLSALLSAYRSSSSRYYQKEEVRQAALEGLDWLLANAYSATGTGYDNWWDWQIAAPGALNSLMMSNYSLLTPARIAAGVAAIDHYMPDPTRRANMNGTVSANATVEVAANLLDKVLVSVLSGILIKDSARITIGRNAIPSALAYVSSGDGYYTDGSFIQHKYHAYVGNYGKVVLANINKLYYLLNDTNWSISDDPNYYNPYDWAMNAFRPFIFDGAMMDGQRGRIIADQLIPDHVSGRSVIAALAELAYALPAAQGNALKSVIKGWVQRDGSFGESYFAPTPGSSVSKFAIAQIKALLNDPYLPAAPEPSETRAFPSVDRVVSRGDGYAFALSMFSKRIGAFESVNGENTKGWWSGMGMTYLYNADQTQYSNNFWPTVDMWRLPGTTTDHSGHGTPSGTKFNNRTAVGSAELNRQFATSAMDFGVVNVTGSSLVGKKAWFMFGDRIVAVGSGITSSNGVKVETIVENRALNGAGDNQLTVNRMEDAKPGALGWTQAMPATRWAHLAGNTSYGADIGYVFPDQPTVDALREARGGAWREIHDEGSTDVVGNNFLSLALNHGSNPTNAAYTYILLPNRSVEETAAFAAANPITVIERSTSATAVMDGAQGVTGIVFWNDATKTVTVSGQPFVTSDKKAVVTLQQTGSDLQLAVADPTQLNTGVIKLELHRTGSLVSKDDAISVLNPGGSPMKLAVNVNGAQGKSFEARFALSNSTSVTPGGDAYLRDGNYADTNFGAATSLTIKEGSAGFARNALLKFDLSAIGGTIVSAKLKLVPTVVGTSGVTHKLYQTATDSWTEGTVTWNTMPDNGIQLGSWTVPAVNTPVEVDVTAAVQSIMAGGKVLSLKLEAAPGGGSNGNVDYASKETGTSNNRPALVVVYR